MATAPPGRVLGLDLGDARIGVAISDDHRRLAVPLGNVRTGAPADLKAVAALVTDVAKKFGRLDILVNNAGVFQTGAVGDPAADATSFERQDQVNVDGVVAAIDAAARVMGEDGRIVTIGSAIAARAGYQGMARYAATKAALGLETGGLVMEGFRRVDEWRLIEGSFDFDEVLYHDTVAIERLGQDANLTRQERAVLGAIDGEKTIREIVDLTGGSSFELCKILYQFLNSRLVRRRAA